MEQFNGALASKLPRAGTTIFTIMSSLAQQHGAINLSQGFPNFPVSPILIDLVHDKMKAGYNQYAPMPGVPQLRQCIADKMEKLYSATFHPDSEITITAGGTQAIYTAITSVIREGDEVILFEPAYDSYIPAIELSGGIAVPVHLKLPDFHIDWNEVKRKVNHKTRMILINTPHNPCGSILSAKDMHQLEKITSGTDIIILSDEVYEHIIFDGYEHQSVARYPKLASRSLIVFSFGKTYHATGWKCGYVLAPEKLMHEFRKVHQFNVFSVNTPLQLALAEFMKEADAYESLPAFYARKRDFFLEQMKGSRFKPLPCSGSYFQLFDYRAITKEKDTEFAKKLTRENGVAAIPVSVFYKKPPEQFLMRFCFAKDDETLRAAALKLKSV